MRYKPERALTPHFIKCVNVRIEDVEMRYKPERALTPFLIFLALLQLHGPSSACPRQKYAETSKMQKSLPFPKCFRISSGR